MNISLPKKTKIFIVCLDDITGFKEAIALSENGKVLAHINYHNEDDVPYDLGLRGTTNTNHHADYNHAHPHGWELIFVNRKSMAAHKELQAALRTFIHSRPELDDEVQPPDDSSIE